jgi:hypothetical protein
MVQQTKSALVKYNIRKAAHTSKNHNLNSESSNKMSVPKSNYYGQIPSNLRQSGHAVAQLVEALCYKPEGRGFDSR